MDAKEAVIATITEAMPRLWAEHTEALQEQLAGDAQWTQGDDYDLVVTTALYRRRGEQRVLIGENVNGAATLATNGEDAQTLQRLSTPGNPEPDTEQASVPRAD